MRYFMTGNAIKIMPIAERTCYKSCKQALIHNNIAHANALLSATRKTCNVLHSCSMGQTFSLARSYFKAYPKQF